MITPFERFSKMANEDVTPTLRMAEFLEAITRQVNLNTPIKDSGSPEGAVTADIGQFYIDTSGAAGSRLYEKASGSGNTGWILA